MAGKPNTRIKKLTNTLTEALASGEREVARLAYAEIRRTAEGAGMDMPQLPAEATELWLQVTQASGGEVAAQQPVEARISDATRATLVRAGDLAAGHLLRLMEEPGLFGPLGLVPVREQVGILNTVMGRSFGSMPMGAQRVGSMPKDEQPEGEQVGSTLTMMIRQKQQPATQPASYPMRVVGDEATDISPDGWSDVSDET